MGTTGVYLRGKFSVSKADAKKIVHSMTEEKRASIMRSFMGADWDKARKDLTPEFISKSLTIMLMVGIAHLVNGEFVFGGAK